MIRQQTFSDMEYSSWKCVTRRESFLKVMRAGATHHQEVVYRGLLKNLNRLYVLFGSTNLLM